MSNKLKSFLRWVKYYLSIFCDFREYHFFPFDHNKPMPYSAREVISLCCEELELIGVKYRIADGTALGLYRQGDFIPHDNDIDVEVLDCDQVAPIMKSMLKLGFKLGRKVVYIGKVQQLVFFNSNDVIFDIVFWYSNGSDIKNYCERGYERTQDLYFFENMQSYEYFGKRYPFPTPIEEWLELHYGADWGTPKLYKGDWKDECKDLKALS